MADPARRKPIPAPIARASAPRALRPARSVGVLPTVAALLAATAAIACQREPLPIAQDSTEPVPPRPHMVADAELGTKSIDPAGPLPGMAALDPLPAVPTAEPPKPHVPVTITPPSKPPLVKGRIAPVHPTPVAPGGLKAIHPPTPSPAPSPTSGTTSGKPIAPTPTPKKLAGDVAVVEPETT